jgi:hypothetical protein
LIEAFPLLGRIPGHFWRFHQLAPNQALVKKDNPTVGTTYDVGAHYEALVPAVFPLPAPTDLEARQLGSVASGLTETNDRQIDDLVYELTEEDRLRGRNQTSEVSKTSEVWDADGRNNAPARR